jgi:hypothetical protein
MSRKTSFPPRARAEIAAHVAAQFRYSRSTQQDYLKDWAFHRAVDQAPQVTNAMFRQRAKQRGWSTKWLVECIWGEVDRPTEVIKRIMGLAEPFAVIPYPVLTELYHDKKPAAASKRGACQYGCGHRVMGQQRFATDACRKRVSRRVA